MSAEAANMALLQGRRAAEALMVDTCAVRRPIGDRTPDEFGRIQDQHEDVYAGRCRVKPPSEQAASAEAGSRTTVLQRARIDIPVTAGPLLAGDLVEITASAHAPFLVGAVYRVAEPADGSMTTAQRVPADREVRA